MSQPRVEKDIEVYDKQAEFCDSDAWARAFCGGRGTGKSWIGAFDIITRALPDRTYLVGSPDGTVMGDTTWPMFQEIAKELDIWYDCEVRTSPWPNVVLPNGATIRFRSTDQPDRRRGPNLAGAWLDEASLMPEAAYQIVLASLRAGGESGHETGWLSATFTPKGPSHWTYETFAKKKPDTFLVRATTFDNPFLPADFADMLQRQYGEGNFARQELGGEFLQMLGARWPGDWFTHDGFWFSVWPDDLDLKIIALDPSAGNEGSDDQAHVMIGWKVREGKHCIYVDAWLDLEGAGIFERTAKLVKSFGKRGRPVDCVVVEENGTMGFMTQGFDAASKKHGVYIPYLCRTNSENKQVRIITQVEPPLSRRELRFKRGRHCDRLVGQLQSFPFDERDDGPDALSTGLAYLRQLIQPT